MYVCSHHHSPGTTRWPRPGFPPIPVKPIILTPDYTTYSMGTGTNQKDKDPLDSFLSKYDFKLTCQTTWVVL